MNPATKMVRGVAAPAIVAALLVAPAAAHGAQPVVGSRYEQNAKKMDMIFNVASNGRAQFVWSGGRCHGVLWGEKVKRKDGGALGAIRVTADGHFSKRLSHYKGFKKFSMAVSGSFEQDGEWISGKFRESTYWAQQGNWSRCSSGGWIKFRAHMAYPAYLPGTWSGTTSQGLPVASLEVPRLTGVGVIERFAFTVRVSCTEWSQDADGNDVERQWSEDRALDVPLKADMLVSGKFSQSATAAGHEVAIEGQLKGRTGTGTFEVQPENTGNVQCDTAQGTFTVAWRSR